MIKRFALGRLFHPICVIGLLGFSTTAIASAFQLWDQDAAGVGNYHAGRAALANDASTSYYNPAGINRIKNQQLVIGDVAILSDIQYRGTVSTNTYQANAPQMVTAQGGSFSQIPDLHYVAPISDKVGFGLSIATPFSLKTNYGRNTALQYASTMSRVQVVDVSPALAFNLTQTFSVGIGLDAQRMGAEFDQTVTSAGVNSMSTTKGWDTAYGFHVGALYEFLPTTRFGLAYNSQVVHHIRGTSRLVGPIANTVNSAVGSTATSIVSPYANTHLTLPPFTTFSAYHQLDSRWAVMGTAIFTQWQVFQNLTIKNVASAQTSPTLAASTATINLPAHYRNTWNFSVGTDYMATEKLTLRTGVGYDQSPVSNTYRNVQIPDSNRYALAFGGHFQATKTMGFDLGWTHLFIPGNATVNPPAQVSGGQVVTTNGKVSSNADVFGAQFTWDIL